MGFALGALSLLALAFVGFYPKQELALVADPSRVRGFKGETCTATIKLGTRAASARVRLDLTDLPGGVEASLQEKSGTYVLTVMSPFAGLFNKFKVEVGIGDPMGFFARKEPRQLQLAFEFLPLSLLMERRQVRVAPLVTGDRPAGKRGFGQEYFSAETSNSPHSPRDILWRRQARSTSNELMVRVGEANLPENLSLGLAEPNNRSQRENPRWIDLVSEAVASLGRPIVTAGSTLTVIHAVEESVTISKARNEAELADLIIGLWRDDVPKQESMVPLNSADLVVLAQWETSSLTNQMLLRSKPAVLLSWSPRATSRQSKVAIFSGHEDLGWLVARTAGR